ncbi:MAG TPA: TonB-dependent receptor [Bryobacteraceae bacterium]|nr:TonB-dependent receptor [Bryobacteraceae bacterium]
MTRLILACVLCAAAARAQVQLRGEVVSDTNAPLDRASVIIESADHAVPVKVQAFTDPTGAFVIELPRPGEYLVDVEHDGYFRLTGRHLTVSQGGNELRLTLNPLREVAQSVDVTASSTAVDIDTAASHESLNGNELLNIPYPTTQNLRNAMRVLPGLVQDNQGNIHLSGGAERQVLYTLDGFNVADPLTGNFDTRISVEGIQSMDVLSGAFSAQYGKGSAGVLEVHTKLGDDRLRYSATNFIPGLAEQRGLHIGGWTPRFNLSGPIKKGFAWFSDSLAAQYDETIIRELPANEDSATSWRFTNFLHTQVNLTPSNILYGGFLVNWYAAARTGLGALNPPPTTTDQRSRQWFFNVKDQIYFSRGSLVEFGYASNRTFNRQIPQGDSLYIMTPFGDSGNYFVNSRQQAGRDQWLTNYFLPSFRLAGAHQLKVGIDLDRLSYFQNTHRTGFSLYNIDNRPVRTVTFAGNGVLGRSNFESSGYVQDSWRVHPGLLVEAGARMDWDEILRNWNVSPRAGVAWSPPHLEHTKISGGYAINYDATSLPLFTRAFDQYPVTVFYPPYGAPNAPAVSLFTIPNGHLASPRYRTWSAALDQRLPGRIFLRLQALNRRGDHNLGYIDTQNSPAEIIYSLASRGTNSYDSYEVTVRHNFRNEYEWMASYTRSRALSNAVIDLTQDNPLLVADNAGHLGWDTPNRFLSSGYLPTFWRNWALAYLLEARSGFPFSIQDELGRVVGPANSMRYPNFFELDLFAERRFAFRGQNWALRFGFDNITNHSNPNGVNNDVDSPAFLQYYGGQTRALNLRIRWLGKLSQ